jgi:hypothetical protein
MTETIIAIERDRFLLGGRPTHEGRSWRGHRVEGLLFNSRMANAIADDENPATRGAWSYADGEWDAERNLREFIAALPEYRAHGLDAVCLNLMGGSPQGYSWHQPWRICGFTAEGAIKPAWADRLKRVIAAADAHRMAVVLGLFYGKQSGTLRDEAAVRAAVTNAVDLLVEARARNVLLEIGNEVDLPLFAHPVISAPRCDELIRLAQERSTGRMETPAGRLLVSTSLVTLVPPPPNIVACADFFLPHGNHVNGPAGREQPSPHGIRLHVAMHRSAPGYRGQPILYNEDDHFDFDQPDNHFVAAVESSASWGYFGFRKIRERFEDGFQSLPVDWRISSVRKRGFFGLLKNITGT